MEVRKLALARLQAGAGPEELTELLLAHGNQEPVAEWGCWHARTLATKSLQSLLELVAAGGANAVLFVMRAHTQLVTVQTDGSACIACIASGDDGCRKMLLAVGGVGIFATASRAKRPPEPPKARGCA